MPRGVSDTYSGAKRSAAAKKGAARRKAKPRGKYRCSPQPELRAILDKLQGEPNPLDAGDAPPTPGAVAERIDAVLSALERLKVKEAREPIPVAALLDIVRVQ